MKLKFLTIFFTLVLYGCEYTSNPIANNSEGDTNDFKESSSAQEDDGIYFEEHIKPIMAISCMPCHGPGNPKNWQDFKATRKYSLDILASVKHEAGYKAMPMGKDKLKADQVQLIKDWIDSGMAEKAPIIVAEKPKPSINEDPLPNETTSEPIEQTSSESELIVEEIEKTEMSIGEAIYKNNCASCHDNSAMYPRLAGQQNQYLFDQLKDFQKAENGGRVDPIMNYYAQNILKSDDEIREVAKYLSELDPCDVPKSSVELVLSEEDLPVDIQNGKSSFQNCTSCHTDSNSNFPVLNGQNSNYILKTLLALKSQTRPSNTMKYMLGGVTRKQMIDISGYLNSKLECEQ